MKMYKLQSSYDNNYWENVKLMEFSHDQLDSTSWQVGESWTSTEGCPLQHRCPYWKTLANYLQIIHRRQCSTFSRPLSLLSSHITQPILQVKDHLIPTSPFLLLRHHSADKMHYWHPILIGKVGEETQGNLHTCPRTDDGWAGDLDFALWWSSMSSPSSSRTYGKGVYGGTLTGFALAAASCNHVEHPWCGASVVACACASVCVVERLCNQLFPFRGGSMLICSRVEELFSFHYVKPHHVEPHGILPSADFEVRWRSFKATVK